MQTWNEVNALPQAMAASGRPSDVVTRVGTWVGHALVWFPVIDYTLRHGPWHIVGVVWDKLVLLILIILAGIRYARGYRPPGSTWRSIAVVLVLYLLARMFAGIQQPLISFQGFRNDVYYLIFALLLPYVLEAEQAPKLLYSGAVCASLIGVDGVYQYVAAVPIPSGWVDVSEHVRTRVFSVIQSPNELGAYMALTLPLVAGMMVYERHRVRRLLLAVGTVCCLAAFVFSNTRGAWMAFFAAAVLVAIIFERRLLLLLVIIVAVALLLPPVHHRLSNLFSPVYWTKSAVQGGRLDKWATAFNVMLSEPLWGAGLGQYGGAVASTYLGGAYSDNYYAKTVGEAGIVGLTLLLATHLALIRDVIRDTIFPAHGRLRWARLGVVTGLIAVICHNAVENVFEYGPMAISYFTYATLVLCWATSSATSQRQEHAMEVEAAERGDLA